MAFKTFDELAPAYCSANIPSMLPYPLHLLFLLPKMQSPQIFSWLSHPHKSQTKFAYLARPSLAILSKEPPSSILYPFISHHSANHNSKLFCFVICCLPLHQTESSLRAGTLSCLVYCYSPSARVRPGTEKVLNKNPSPPPPQISVQVSLKIILDC